MTANPLGEQKSRQIDSSDFRALTAASKLYRSKDTLKIRQGGVKLKSGWILGGRHTSAVDSWWDSCFNEA
jgi:hypothetical protein